MIPKTIHYCWFGGNPLPPLAEKCIKSWKKFFPDYEIKEWNETNFDVNCCDYVREAYEAKKWAFVSDYARFKILYEYGGVYFDTDVEVIKSFNNILANGAFMGCETEIADVNAGLGIAVAPGLGIAVAPGLGIYKELLEGYNTRHFRNADGTFDQTTIVEYTTECLKRHGLKAVNEIQTVAGITIYPKEFFNPTDMTTGKIKITENTASIHHYMASWCDKQSIRRGKMYQFLSRCFGKKFADSVRKKFGRR